VAVDGDADDALNLASPKPRHIFSHFLKHAGVFLHQWRAETPCRVDHQFSDCCVDETLPSPVNHRQPPDIEKLGVGGRRRTGDTVHFFFLEMGCPRPLHQSMHTAVLLQSFKRLQVSSNGR
jgi:hypothetical protein